MACGRLQYPPQEAVERSARQMREFARCAADTGQLEFDALVRLVEAKDPSFRG